MIELFIALGAGLISFLSPCVLPLIPGYISFISGQSLNELIESKKVNIVPLSSIKKPLPIEVVVYWFLWGSNQSIIIFCDMILTTFSCILFMNNL